jgi:hypothetical protein
MKKAVQANGIKTIGWFLFSITQQKYNFIPWYAVWCFQYSSKFSVHNTQKCEKHCQCKVHFFFAQCSLECVICKFSTQKSVFFFHSVIFGVFCKNYKIKVCFFMVQIFLVWVLDILRTC